MKYIVFSLLCILSLSSCTQKTRQKVRINDPSLAKVIVKKELTIGVDPTIPPLSFYASTGKLVGYEVDIAHEIADKLGVELNVVPITSENRFEKLADSTIDYLASGFTVRHDMREGLSQPYLRDALVVVVYDSMSRTNVVNTFSDLRNKRIGMVSDAELIKITKDSPLLTDSSAELRFYPRMEQLLTALDYGELDAVVMNLLTYFNKITKEKKKYRIIGDPLVIATYSYTFRKDDIHLCTTIDSILTELSKDSTLRDISNKWFGADVSIVGKY
ncbi:MAG: substrate-binding periplasmic protein [Treponema sp.]